MRRSYRSAARGKNALVPASAAQWRGNNLSSVSQILMANARAPRDTADRFHRRKARCPSRPPCRSSVRVRLCGIFCANLFGSLCLAYENIHPSSHNEAPVASSAYSESAHNHLRETFQVPSDSLPENPSKRPGKLCFGGHKSGGSPATLAPPTIRPSHRTRRGRPSRPCSQPSRRGRLESAGKFCESHRRRNEFYPAHLRQDFAGQEISAGLPELCQPDPRAADNDVRNRLPTFLRRSRSNDDLCTCSETPVSMRRNSAAQRA